MKRCLTTVMILAACSGALRADVTVVQTTTVEGGPAAMMGGAGASMSPKMTVRIKGMKQRSDIEAVSKVITTITDLTTKQIVLLRADQKTAQVIGNGAAMPAMPEGLNMPTIEASMQPTGKSQMLDGLRCDEYAFTSSIDMGSMAGAKAPPEAAAMLKGLSMQIRGSIWVSKDAPGAAEYAAFTKAASKSDLMSSIASAMGSNPAMEKMMKAMSNIDGIAYLTEMTMTVEGSGQIADMMKQMGAMRITSKVSSISSETVSDDLFQVPADYTIVKH
jgi:hypothetical protein